MSSARQDSKDDSRFRWLTWIAVSFLVLGFLAVGMYAALFIRITAPRSVRVVDALTGKPLTGMKVCLQATGSGLGGRQALESSLHITDASGRAWFGPTIINLDLLQGFDGYAMDVTDSEGHIYNCGPQIGLEMGRSPNQFNSEFADVATDGSQHFPVEFVPNGTLPKNIAWFPFMRDTTFHSFMSVQLIPLLDGPDQCKQMSNSGLLQECERLNNMAQNALLQSLVPMRLGEMRRLTLQAQDAPSSKNRIYYSVYESGSVPPRYIAVTIERLPKGQNAEEHLDEITRAIPNYDPKDVTEEEPVLGERIKRIPSAPYPRAFWASNNKLILITFLTPSPFDQLTPAEWLRLHPTSATEPGTETSAR